MDNERDREIYESFAVEVFPDRDRVIVAPRGEIDLATVELVRHRLQELEHVGFRSLVLDLRSVTFIDSAGVSLILAELKKVNIDFAVMAGPPQVQRILEVTGLIERIPFVSPTARHAH
jgi:anti-anti-sigma factor